MAKMTKNQLIDAGSESSTVSKNDVKAVMELASFGQFSDIHLAFLDQLTQSIGIVLNTIAATGPRSGQTVGNDPIAPIVSGADRSQPLIAAPRFR